jgi:hypothetical protein
MLEHLRAKASDRKLRLFGCACCRRIWYLLTDERSQRAVEVAEAFAEGRARKEVLEAARIEARAAGRLAAGRSYPSSYQRKVAQMAAEAAADLTSKKVSKVVGTLAGKAAAAVAEEAGLEGARRGIQAHARAAKLSSESGSQRALLIECFGPLPFRSVAVDPTWLAWNGGTVPALAEAVYDDRARPAGTLDGERLAVLADALEEAGCTDADLLDHCRHPGVHVRGCWLLDRLLAKE